MNADEIINKINTRIKISEDELIFLAANYKLIDQRGQDAIKSNKELEMVIQYLIRRCNTITEVADQAQKGSSTKDKTIEEQRKLIEELWKRIADEERWSETFRDQSESIWGIWRDAGRGWRVNF